MGTALQLMHDILVPINANIINNLYLHVVKLCFNWTKYDNMVADAARKSWVPTLIEKVELTQTLVDIISECGYVQSADKLKEHGYSPVYNPKFPNRTALFTRKWNSKEKAYNYTVIQDNWPINSFYNSLEDTEHIHLEEELFVAHLQPKIDKIGLVLDSVMEQARA